MFIAALILSILGFILLVITVMSDSHFWTWLLIIVVSGGIICFGIDEWRNRRKNSKKQTASLTSENSRGRDRQ